MKNFKLLIPVAIMGFLLIAPGCTLYSRKGTTQASHVFLEKSDYVLSQRNTAKGVTKIVFGFSTGENDKAAEVTTYSTHGTGGFAIPTGCCLAAAADPVGYAKSIALYNLLEKNPGYDAVMSPNYKVEIDIPCGIPQLFSTTTVTVTARLIKYN